MFQAGTYKLWSKFVILVITREPWKRAAYARMANVHLLTYKPETARKLYKE